MRDPQKRRESCRTYYERHREERLAYSREYYARKRDEILARGKAHRAQGNPEDVARAQRIAQARAKNSAKMRAAMGIA